MSLGIMKKFNFNECEEDSIKIVDYHYIGLCGDMTISTSCNPTIDNVIA